MSQNVQTIPATTPIKPHRPNTWIGRVLKLERNFTVMRSRITRTVRDSPYFDLP